jgi:hypothetical protein
MPGSVSRHVNQFPLDQFGREQLKIVDREQGAGRHTPVLLDHIGQRAAQYASPRLSMPWTRTVSEESRSKKIRPCRPGGVKALRDRENAHGRVTIQADQAARLVPKPK